MAVKRDKILREAEKLVQKGRTEQAIKEYEKLLKLNPNDANTINRVGDLYGRIGKVEKAVELYERIAQHFTEDGFTTKAIAILKKINRIAPDRLDIFEQLSDLYLQQGLLVEAKNQLQMVADWYVNNGDSPNAIRVLERIAKVDPDNHMAQLRLADLLLQSGEHERATEVYDRLGTMLLAHERLDEAERLYRHVLEANPPSGEVFLPICRALVEAGRVNSAREFIEATAQRCEGNEEIQAYRIQLLAASGDREEAIRASEQALESAPESIELRAAAGKVLLASGEGERAKGLLLPLLESLEAQGAIERVQAIIRGLLEMLPADRDVLERAVQLFEKVGDEETKLTLKAALADACYRAGEEDQAVALYAELVELVPDQPMFRERLTKLGGSAGSSSSIEVGGPSPGLEPSAVPGVKDVIETDKTREAGGAEGDPQERLAEATVFAKYGLVDKAIQHLEDLVMEVPDFPEARERLVALLAERGQNDKARDVAGPLEAYYRKEGQVRELKALRAVLKEGEAEPSTAEEEDSVLVIDFEEESGAREGGESSVEAEPAVVESPEELQDATASAADGESDAGEQVLELDLDGPVTSEPDVAPEPDADAKSDAEVLGSEAKGGAGPATTIADLADLERSLRQGDGERARSSGAVNGGRAAVEDLLGNVGLDIGSQPPQAQEQSQDTPAEILADEDLRAAPQRELVEEELVEITDHLAGPPLRDLEQLDFLTSQALYDDALRMLEQLEASFPGDAELESRRAELGAKGLLLEQEPGKREEAADELFDEEEGFIDLAKELEEELEAEDLMVEEATGRGQDEALLEEVFREFQKGVSQQLSEEDSDTHFNLGIAYKEMGLLPEAIGEFQISAKNPAYQVEGSSMIGMCYMEQGLAEDAAEWYRRALDSDLISDDARLGVLYDLGNALEQAGNVAEAVEAFNSILRASSSYRDVAERLQHLESLRQAN